MLTDFPKILEVKNINFPVKIKDIHKVEKKNSISDFCHQYKKKYPTHVSKKCCNVVKENMLTYY